MDNLTQLEQQSIYIMREAYANYRNLAMLWSFGKDSTVMIWLARKAFFGNIPFPLVHCDTGLEMDEVYAYRDNYVKEWNLKLISEQCPPLEEMDPTLPPASRIASRKTAGLKNAVKNNNFEAIIAGIRRDEQGTRAKERVFSPRGFEGEWESKEQPPEFWNFFKTNFPAGTHIRVHPLLHWTELDVWEYIGRHNIPMVPLYFANEQGMRYRSIGEKGITFPIQSTASNVQEIIEELRITKQPERAGRAMDHESEDSFERLRKAGYM